jgi:hypothetical protein
LKDLFKSKKIGNFKLKWNNKLVPKPYFAISTKYKTIKNKYKIKNRFINFLKNAKMFWLAIYDEKISLEVPLKYVTPDQNKLNGYINSIKLKMETSLEKETKFSKNNRENLSLIYSMARNMKGVIKKDIANIEIPFTKSLNHFLNSIVEINRGKNSFSLSDEKKDFLIKKVCNSHKELIEIALKLWKIDNASGSTPNIKELIEAGYLVRTPLCPEGGEYSIQLTDDEIGFYVKCSKHK